MSEAEKLDSEQVFTGKVFSIDRDHVKMPNGRTVTVDVVRHSKSVVLVPVPELEDLKGIAKGADPDGYRDRDDRY